MAGIQNNKDANFKSDFQQYSFDVENLRYAISHDLKAPLRAIEGFSKILAKEHEDLSGLELQQYTKRIQFNAALLRKQIEALARFLHIHNKTINLQLIDQTKLVKEIASSFVNDSIQIDVVELPKVKGDFELIEMIWKELINNAVAFSRPKTKNNISIILTEVGSQLIYQIKDQGEGFNPKKSDDVFKLFHKAKIDEERLGVGLTFAKIIAEKHQGKIWINPNEEEGTIVSFTLNL